MLTTLFGALGLALAAVGLFGVLAYNVERRTGEIGVRMALGANRGHVLGMVLGGALRQVVLGLAIGIPASIGAGRLMTTQLFGVEPSDPMMLAAATLLLGLAAIVAAFIPGLAGVVRGTDDRTPHRVTFAYGAGGRNRGPELSPATMASASSKRGSRTFSRSRRQWTKP